MRFRSVLCCAVAGLITAASSAALAQPTPPAAPAQPPKKKTPAPPTDPKAGEAKPGEAGEAKPGEAGDAKPGEAGQAKPGEGGDTKPAEPGTTTAPTTAPTEGATPAPAETPPATPPPSTAPETAPAGTPPTTTAPVAGPTFTANNPPPMGDTGEKKAEPKLPPYASSLGFELNLGVIGRLDSGGDYEKAGLTLGPSVWYSPNRMFSFGLGYDRVRGGVDRPTNPQAGYDVQHDMDHLWVGGRGYPWRNDDMGVYVTLGLGLGWQHVQANGARVQTGLVASAEPYSCSASSSAAFAGGGGVGFDLDVSRDVQFVTQADITHYSNSSSSVGGCADGSGPMTGLGAKIGFAYRFDTSGGATAKSAARRGNFRF